MVDEDKMIKIRRALSAGHTLNTKCQLLTIITIICISILNISVLYNIYMYIVISLFHMHYSFEISSHACEIDRAGITTVFAYEKSKSHRDWVTCKSLKIRHLPDKTHWLMNIPMLPQGPGSSWPKYLSEMNPLAKGKKRRSLLVFVTYFNINGHILINV